LVVSQVRAQLEELDGPTHIAVAAVPRRAERRIAAVARFASMRLVIGLLDPLRLFGSAPRMLASDKKLTITVEASIREIDPLRPFRVTAGRTLPIIPRRFADR
jgi:hypothetical protein